MTAAVLATAGQDDKAKHRPELWEDPIRYGLQPFMSGIAMEEAKYNRSVVGVEIAVQFLNILLDAVAMQGGALPSFEKFLSGQGQTIQIKAENNGEGYKYACVGMVHEK